VDLIQNKKPVILIIYFGCHHHSIHSTPYMGVSLGGGRGTVAEKFARVMEKNRNNIKAFGSISVLHAPIYKRNIGVS